MFSIVVVAFIGCHNAPTYTDFEPQKIVDAFVDLQPHADLEQELDLMRGESVRNKFDVNKYFTVLSKLRPDSGHVLDWVYFNRRIGGLPVLYAREINACPFMSFDKYAFLSTNSLPIEVSSTSQIWEHIRFGYIEKLRVEDSPNGYFQLIILRLLGDRFHLFWHEYYNETFLVCSRSAWESLLQKEKKRGNPYKPPPLDFITAAHKLDFMPKVHMKSEQVEVNVITYQPFAGINQHSFTISRQYPHRIVGHTASNLLQHTQEFSF